MKRLIAAGVLLALAAVAPVQAAPVQEPTTLYLVGRAIISPVDHETWCGDCVGPGEEDYTINSPWTINPGWVTGYTPPIIDPPEDPDFGGIAYGCLYDSDDYFEYRTTGNVLSEGASLIATECVWRQVSRFSYGGPWFMTRFTSSSPDLVITWTWDWGAGQISHTIPAVAFPGKEWRYDACVLNPQAPGGEVIPVPGSHDGDGIWEVITITVTNPGRKASKTGGLFLNDFRDNGAWCPDGPTQID